MFKSCTRTTLCLALVSLLAITAFAAASLHHSIWTHHPLAVKDGDTGTWYNSFDSGNAIGSWTESTRQGYFNATAQVSRGSNYEFDLMSINGSDNDSIDGVWDIKRDGTVVCDGCVGTAYGLSGGVGDYFKIYIGDRHCYSEKWHFSGYIDDRFDY
jgi:opacity protein-like surface antigen